MHHSSLLPVAMSKETAAVPAGTATVNKADMEKQVRGVEHEVCFVHVCACVCARV